MSNSWDWWTFIPFPMFHWIVYFSTDNNYCFHSDIVVSLNCPSFRSSTCDTQIFVPKRNETQNDDSSLFIFLFRHLFCNEVCNVFVHVCVSVLLSRTQMQHNLIEKNSNSEQSCMCFNIWFQRISFLITSN